jgi:hypothetical protein
MARYYFHMSNDGELVRDQFGEEFARDEDAHAHAVRVASKLARNNSAQSRNGRRLIVMDETSRFVCNVPLPIDD